MPKRRITLGILFLSALCLWTGCASHWTVARGKRFSVGTGAYGVCEPQGWMVFRNAETTFFSKHGAELDAIIITSKDISKPRADSAPQPRPDMKVHEIGEIVLFDYYSSPAVQEVEVLRESPCEIAGHGGVKLELRYTVQGNITKRAVIEAFISGTRFHQLTYSAVERHYFNACLDEYNKTAATFFLR